MNDKQENWLSMSRTVQNCLNQNIAIVSSGAAFLHCKIDLDHCISAIDELVKQQSKQTGGITKDKIALRQQVIAAAVELKAPVVSYAIEKNMYDLAEQLSYSTSDLKNMRANKLPGTLALIRDVVQKALPDVADYGVTQADIDAFNDLIAAYDALNMQPRNAINNKSILTKQLIEAFASLKIILLRMDGFVLAQKKKEPVFYDAYRSARMILDKTGKSKKAGEIVHATPA